MSRKEEIEARKLEIRKEVENAETTEQVEKLDKEVDALNEESKQIAEQEEEKSISDEMEKRTIEVKELKKVEEKSMKEEMKEIRNSKKYIDAYAEYIKSGLVKDVADIDAAIGDESTEGTILARIKALEDAQPSGDS